MGRRPCHFMLIILLHAGLVVRAQRPPYHHYTAEDGLVNNTVYVIEQDSLGRMWMGTEGGLCMFDGGRFVNYSLYDGLNSNIVTGLSPAPDGGVYAIHYTGGINHVALSGVLTGQDLSPFACSHGFVSGPWVYLLRLRAQELFRFPVDDFMKGTFPGELQPFQTGRAPVIHRFDGLQLTLSDAHYAIHGDQLTVLFTGATEPLICGIHSSDGTTYYVTRTGLHHSDGRVLLEMDPATAEGVTCMQADLAGRIWMIIHGKLFLFDHRGLHSVNEMLDMPSTTVNTLFHDRDGNIWASTSGKGVFCFFHHFIEHYTGKEGLINPTVTTLSLREDGHVVAGTRGGVSVLDTTGKFLSSRYTAFVYNTLNKPDSLIVFGAPPDQYQEQIGKLHVRWWRVPSALVLEDGTAIMAGQRRVIVHAPGQPTRAVVFPEVEGATEDRTDVIQRDGSGRIWVGGRLGLFILDPAMQHLSLPEGQREVLSSHVHDIFVDDHSQEVWIAADLGVVVFRNGQYELIDPADDRYSLEGAFAVEKDHLGRCWIGCNQGLFVWENGDVRTGFDKKNGLSSYRVLDLLFDRIRRVLWVGTDDGLTRIDLRHERALMGDAPKVYIVSISSLAVPGAASLPLVLRNGESTFTTVFQAIDYSSGSQVRYRYWVDDEHRATETSEGRALLRETGFGRHTLFVQARVGRGEWGPVASVDFFVPAPVYARWWFILSVILLVGLLITLIVRWRWNLLRRRTERDMAIREQIMQLRQQALATSINPHFIFNALNSIQYLVGAGESEKAHEYIARLGKLIRANLESSRNGTTTLAHELERLQHYFELEQLRVGERLQLEVNVAPAIRAEGLLIPIMIIQPFVENSIWHGIVPSGNGGTIRVNVAVTPDNFLEIRITDDGVGLHSDKHLGKPGRRSLGVRMIEERLDLLNNGLCRSVQLRDRSSDGPGIHGAEVILTLAPGTYSRL